MSDNFQSGGKGSGTGTPGPGTGDVTHDAGASAGRVGIWTGTTSLDGDADLTFATDTLTATKIVTTQLTDSGLTSGRVTFATTGGKLTDDSDLTFSGSTLTSTNHTVTSALVTKTAEVNDNTAMGSGNNTSLNVSRTATSSLDQSGFGASVSITSSSGGSGGGEIVGLYLSAQASGEARAVGLDIGEPTGGASANIALRAQAGEILFGDIAADTGETFVVKVDDTGKLSSEAGGGGGAWGDITGDIADQTDLQAALEAVQHSSFTLIGKDTTERTGNAVGAAANLLSIVTDLNIKDGEVAMFVVKHRHTAGAAGAPIWGFTINGTSSTNGYTDSYNSVNQAGDGLMWGFITTKSLNMVGNTRRLTQNDDFDSTAETKFDGIDGGGIGPFTTITSFQIWADAANAAITVATNDLYIWRLNPIAFNNSVVSTNNIATFPTYIKLTGVERIGVDTNTPFITHFFTHSSSSQVFDMTLDGMSGAGFTFDNDLDAARADTFITSYAAGSTYLNSGVCEAFGSTTPVGFQAGVDLSGAEPRVAITATGTSGTNSSTASRVSVFPLTSHLAGSDDTETTSTAIGADAGTLSSVTGLSIAQREPFLFTFKHRSNLGKEQTFGIKFNSTVVMSSAGQVLYMSNFDGSFPVSGVTIGIAFPGDTDYKYPFIGYTWSSDEGGGSGNDGDILRSKYRPSFTPPADDPSVPATTITSVSITSDAKTSSSTCASKALRVYALPLTIELDPPQPNTIQLAVNSTYSPTNVTTDRAFDANSTTTDELADVLGTLITDLKNAGILQ